MLPPAIKKDDDNASECTGPAQINVTGAVTGNYCLQDVTNFEYDDHIEINIILNNGGGESVMLFGSVGYAGEGLNPGAGTYQCGAIIRDMCNWYHAQSRVYNT